MDKLIVTLKDSGKREMLIGLLRELTFVDTVTPIQDVAITEEDADDSEGSIFDAAGMWADRDIDAEKLRSKAWKR